MFITDSGIGNCLPLQWFANMYLYFLIYCIQKTNHIRVSKDDLPNAPVNKFTCYMSVLRPLCAAMDGLAC